MELGGFEPPTSWVRSKELHELKDDDLQGGFGRQRGWRIAKYPAIPGDHRYFGHSLA
jgi:hypothetical protein